MKMEKSAVKSLRDLGEWIAYNHLRKKDGWHEPSSYPRITVNTHPFLIKVNDYVKKSKIPGDIFVVGIETIMVLNGKPVHLEEMVGLIIFDSNMTTWVHYGIFPEFTGMRIIHHILPDLIKYAMTEYGRKILHPISIGTGRIRMMNKQLPEDILSNKRVNL
jgi:hypothetical protein